MKSKSVYKLTVLLTEYESRRLDRYCRDEGFKKSTLVARLIRQYLDTEGYQPQLSSDPKPEE